MRYMFFAVIIGLLQLFSLGAAVSLRWWLQPWTTPTLQMAVMMAVFIISNGLLLLSASKLLANSYRWVSGWMLVMHFIILTAGLTGMAYGGYLLSTMVFSSSTGLIITQPPETIVFGLRVFAFVLFIGLFVYALHSAYVPVVRKRTIHINKSMQGQLRIAVASDLHLGRLFGNRAIDRLGRLLVEQRADMLLMPGDIMDDNTHVYAAYDMQHNLTTLCDQLPLGVYATLGNHDLYGHERPISDSLRSAGVHLLNDDVLCIHHQDQPVWLIGRFDNHKRERVATTELLSQVDTTLPVILLDHRPSDIIEHSKLPIDLQVSGHTHDGQIFPANFIVRAINRLGYSYEAIGLGHFVVSSGYGFWGIPFRLGSRSEVWLITVQSAV